MRRFLVPFGSWPQLLEPPPQPPKPHKPPAVQPTPLPAQLASLSLETPLFIRGPGTSGVAMPTAGLSQVFYASEMTLPPTQHP